MQFCILSGARGTHGEGQGPQATSFQGRCLDPANLALLNLVKSFTPMQEMDSLLPQLLFVVETVL